MAGIKLTYFPLRGRMETSRLVLLAAKKDFTDERIEFGDWGARKPTTPWGSLPVLEVDGEQYGQSIAISSYLARENGLYGSSNKDGLKIDQIQLIREDMLVEEVKVFKEKDPEKNAKMVENMNENVYPKYLGFFNKLIAENKAKNPGTQFAVGTQFSLADITIAEGTTTAVDANPTVLEKYPEVAAIREMTFNRDGIKEYIAKRAKTPL